jgi:hypothetical protein
MRRYKRLSNKAPRTFNTGDHKFYGMDVNSENVSGVTDGKQKGCEILNTSSYKLPPVLT